MSKKIMLFTPSALVSALSFLGALFFWLLPFQRLSVNRSDLLPNVLAERIGDQIMQKVKRRNQSKQRLLLTLKTRQSICQIYNRQNFIT
jgi:hypothetical protein